jgi:hypothetical protein
LEFNFSVEMSGIWPKDKTAHFTGRFPRGSTHTSKDHTQPMKHKEAVHAAGTAAGLIPRPMLLDGDLDESSPAFSDF